MSFDPKAMSSHWIQAHGETGDVIAEKAFEGGKNVMDSTLNISSDAAIDLSLKNNGLG